MSADTIRMSDEYIWGQQYNKRRANGILFSWEDVPGWFDWMELYDQVAAETPDGATVVEVGVCFGKSLLYLAQRIKETGRNIKVVAVDAWVDHTEQHFLWHPETATTDYERYAASYAQRHDGLYKAFRYNLEQSGFHNMVRVVALTSVVAAALYKVAIVDRVMAPPYFVFIDADHRAEAVKADIDAWWALGTKWIAGHDYNRGSELDFPGVWKTVDAKFGQENVAWVGQTCFSVRR